MSQDEKMEYRNSPPPPVHREPEKKSGELTEFYNRQPEGEDTGELSDLELYRTIELPDFTHQEYSPAPKTIKCHLREVGPIMLKDLRAAHLKGVLAKRYSQWIGVFKAYGLSGRELKTHHDLRDRVTGSWATSEKLFPEIRKAIGEMRWKRR
jgi:hypothetical protein